MAGLRVICQCALYYYLVNFNSDVLFKFLKQYCRQLTLTRMLNTSGPSDPHWCILVSSFSLLSTVIKL